MKLTYKSFRIYQIRNHSTIHLYFSKIEEGKEAIGFLIKHINSIGQIQMDIWHRQERFQLKWITKIWDSAHFLTNKA